MRPRDQARANSIELQLREFDTTRCPLPGIHQADRRQALLEQMLESIRRVEYIRVLRSRPISNRRADPDDVLFDPIRAAILQQRSGNIEEAFWLIFLFVHFGKHSRGGWRYAREAYRGDGPGSRWDWPRVSASPDAFRDWLRANRPTIQPGGGFGNHRKRESLDADSANGTGAVVKSYVAWVGPHRRHIDAMNEALQSNNGDPKLAFDYLYKSMAGIRRFGRLARFDYLTMIGKLDLAPISPGSAYLQGATGPLAGARLLFGGNESALVLDQRLVELDSTLNVGMQVLEDSLCNWQKSPDQFRPFRD